jgi:hypothetical protein
MWTDNRLQALFDHYNQRFWRGKLPRFRVYQRRFNTDLGHTSLITRKILIDTDAHQSDRQVRGTVLHEMAHLSAILRKSNWKKYAMDRRHGGAFNHELRRLKQLKAPLSAEDRPP